MKIIVFIILYCSTINTQAPDEEYHSSEIEPDQNRFLHVQNNCYRPYGFLHPLLCFTDYFGEEIKLRADVPCPKCPSLSPPTTSTTTKEKTTIRSTTTTTSITYSTKRTTTTTTTLKQRTTTQITPVTSGGIFSYEMVFGQF